MTVALDSEKNTVTGIMNSFSPVVAAVANDGTFGNNYFDLNPLGRIVATADLSRSPQGVQKNEQITIPITIKNMQRVNQQFTVILQITDEDGVAQYLRWQTGEIGRSQSLQLSSKWTPDRPGNYDIKILVCDALDHPSVLSEKYVANIVAR
jgi:hypothetical protein